MSALQLGFTQVLYLVALYLPMSSPRLGLPREARLGAGCELIPSREKAVEDGVLVEQGSSSWSIQQEGATLPAATGRHGCLGYFETKRITNRKATQFGAFACDS